MAKTYINGELHEAEKTVLNFGNKTCSKCGKVHGIAWVISSVVAHVPWNIEKARYCYDCTGNHWARAFRLYKDSQVPNA